MGERTFTRSAFEATRKSVSSEGGSATHRGEQRHREGKGLHPLVDPKGYGVIRRSLNRFEPKGGKFVLTVGQSMLKETRFDTTGSMGSNVEIAFEALPRSFHLLKEVPGAPLGRYDLQIINAIFGDVQDNYVLCRSQAEMDEKIAEQLRYMVPEHDGGDADEDPDYGIFGAAYLTAASVVGIGLKSYDFTVTDARGRGRISPDTLVRVFGKEVFDKVKENGHQINGKSSIDTREVVQDLLKIAHAFVIQVGEPSEITRFWSSLYGRERVVIVPSTVHLPEVEAAIIGLTEGTLDLQSLESFLTKEAQVSKESAKSIRNAVSGIPLGAQARLPNFSKIPKKGDVFASKTDPWPIGFNPDAAEESAPPKVGAKKPGGKPGKMWL